ncbi:hypothetical protein GT50_06960 [Geobacillus stearothermophilus 10]|nr:hypothetical protein GT50_06960 [Geobacillus stearothermophilus 10]
MQNPRKILANSMGFFRILEKAKTTANAVASKVSQFRIRTVRMLEMETVGVEPTSRGIAT